MLTTCHWESGSFITDQSTQIENRKLCAWNEDSFPIITKDWLSVCFKTKKAQSCVWKYLALIYQGINWECYTFPTCSLCHFRGEMTNSSKECDFTDIDRLAETLRLGISIPTFILGLVLNALALSVFCCFWKKQTKTSVYMINLALADVLLLLSLPLKLYYSSTKAPGLLCSFIESLYFINTYGSIFIIVCITVDRYICIRHPFEGRANQSPKWAFLICCIIWTVTWLFSITMYVSPKENYLKCFRNMSEKAWSIPVIVSVEVVGFLIPLVVIVFCSAQNIMILLNHKSQAKKKVEGSGSLRVIIINLVVFMVCFTPVHLAICLQFLVKHHMIVDCSKKQTISLFIQVSMIFANLNCCLDAIFYYFAAEEFREKIHLKNVIELCPVFKPRATRWNCLWWKNILPRVPLASQDADSIIPEITVGWPWPWQGGCRREKDNVFPVNVNLFHIIFPFKDERRKNVRKKNQHYQSDRATPKEALALTVSTKCERLARGKLPRSLECHL